MTDDNEAQSSPESDKAPDKASDKEPDKERAKKSNMEPDKESKKESNEKDESSSETEPAPAQAQSLREPFPFARLFLTIFFGVIASITFWVIVMFAVLQFATIAIAGHKSEELQHISRLAGRFIQEVFDYITLATDTQPFPLGPFPKE